MRGGPEHHQDAGQRGAASAVLRLRPDGFADGAHVAPRNQMRSGPRMDARTTRHPGFQISQRVRKRAEEIFGGMKTLGGLRKLRYRGTAKVRLWTYFSASAYPLVRMTRWLAAS